MQLFRCLLVFALLCPLIISAFSDDTSSNEVESVENRFEDGSEEEPLPSASYSSRGAPKRRKKAKSKSMASKSSPPKSKSKSSSSNANTNLLNSKTTFSETSKSAQSIVKSAVNNKGKQTQQEKLSAENESKNYYPQNGNINIINNDYQPYIEEENVPELPPYTNNDNTNNYQQQESSLPPSIFESSPYPDHENGGKLLQLQIITRRGDRTPFWLTKNDHYKETDFVEGINQQYSTGKRRIVELGRLLRKRYSDFFDDLKPQEIVAEALQDLPGNPHIESTLALLAGLAPPIPEVEPPQIWSHYDPLARLWQPIAVGTIEKARAWKLDPEVPCKSAEIVEKVNITRVPALRKLIEENRPFIKHLQRVTGEDFSPKGRGWMYIGYVLDTIISEAAYFREAFRAPNWLDRPALVVLEQIYDQVYRVFGNAPRYLKTRGGLLLRGLLDNMINTVAAGGTGKPKVYIATTTDNMIAILEHAIGLFLGRPDFGATLLLELRQPRRYLEASSALGYGPAQSLEEPTVHLFYVNATNNFEVYPVPLRLSPRFYRLCPNYLHCTLTNFAVGLKDFVINGGQEEAARLCNQV